MNCCPTCGQALRDDAMLRVDPAGIVVVGTRFARLTQKELSVLEALRAVAPRSRTKEQLLADVYWADHDEPEIKILDVYVCKLRKKLQPLGVTIETVWGQGYRLQPLPVQQEAAA